MKEKIFKYLVDVEEKCIKYSENHLSESKKFSIQNTIFNITNIVITTGVATLTTIVGNVDKEKNGGTAFVVISSFLLYVSAVLNSVQQFLNFEKQSEKNKMLSVRFISLGNNIKRFIALEELNNEDIVEYFKWVSSTFEEILNNTSTIEPVLSSRDLLISEQDNGINILDIDLDNTTVSQGDSKLMKYEIDRFFVNSHNGHC